MLKNGLGLGGGGRAVIRELQEAGGQPADDAGDVRHACQHEAHCAYTRGDKNKTEYEQKIALGSNCGASEQLFREAEIIWIRQGSRMRLGVTAKVGRI